jgi:hypothetical protein
VPTVAFLLGAFMLFRGFKMWLKPVVTEAGTDGKEKNSLQQDDYIQQLEEELKKRK